MQDAMLHYIRLAFATQARKGGPVQRVGDQTRVRRQSALRHLPVQGRRAQRLRLRLHQPRQSRALEAPAAGDRPRGSDRRCALGRRRQRACEHEAEIDAIVADWTKQHDKHEAMRLLGGAGIPAGAVLDTKELIDDQTFHDRGILQVMDHPVVKDYAMPAWPVRHDGAPPPSRPRRCWASIPARCSRAGSASASARSRAWPRRR